MHISGGQTLDFKQASWKWQIYNISFPLSEQMAEHQAETIESSQMLTAVIYIIGS